MEKKCVKQHIRRAERGCDCPPRTPVCVCGQTVTLHAINRKPIRADDIETRANPRARSARMRAAERVSERCA